MNTKRYFVIEGIDGSGKTRFAQTLVERLGSDAVLVREPHDSLFYDNDIFKQRPKHWEVEAMIFQTLRQDIMERLVKPALAEGKIVISDRSWISTLVYQVCAAGLPHQKELSFVGRNASKLDVWYTFLNTVNPRPAHVFELTASLEAFRAKEQHERKIPALIESTYEELCSRYRYIRERFFQHRWTWYPPDVWQHEAHYEHALEHAVRLIRGGDR